MNLADRLRGVLRTGKPDADHSVHISNEYDGVRRMAKLEEALGGAWCGDEGARSFVVERRVSGEETCGHRRVAECAEWVQRAGRPATLLLQQASARTPFVFFDLETTGLSGGAGTHAFLIGCGWFESDGGFVTRQHVMAAHDDEKPMLRAVAADLAKAGVLVSFNGKSFDAPVLETRYLYHRLEWAATAAPHLDLLHPARRFWGSQEREYACSLGILEQRIAGVQRDNDVPGFEIPARYFHFLRSGDANLLSSVLEHNRKDLLSLAVLTSRILQLIGEGSDRTDDARESLALGDLYQRAGETQRALTAYRRAVAIGVSGEAEPAALRTLAIAERRARNFEEAAGHWRRLLENPACPSHVAEEALEALAIHHEHRRRDLEAARGFALRNLRNSTRHRSSSFHDAVQHRLARLERKLERLSEPPLFPFWTSPPSCEPQTSEPRTSS